MLSVFDSLVVACSTRFYDIIVVFGVSFEGNLSVAASALEVEAEDLDVKIGLQVAYLHTHVEFCSNVEIVSTGVAAQTHGQHVPDHHELVRAPASLYDALVVKVFGEIFDKDFPLSHNIIIEALLKSNSSGLFISFNQDKNTIYVVKAA